MRLFEVYITNRGETELEGVFDSHKEIALYFGCAKSIITNIANAEYDKVPPEWVYVSIVEVFDSRSFGADLVSFMADEQPLAQ